MAPITWIAHIEPVCTMAPARSFIARAAAPAANNFAFRMVSRYQSSWVSVNSRKSSGLKTPALLTGTSSLPKRQKATAVSTRAAPVAISALSRRNGVDDPSRAKIGAAVRAARGFPRRYRMRRSRGSPLRRRGSDRVLRALLYRNGLRRRLRCRRAVLPLRRRRLRSARAAGAVDVCRHGRQRRGWRDRHATGHRRISSPSPPLRRPPSPLHRQLSWPGSACRAPLRSNGRKEGGSPRLPSSRDSWPPSPAGSSPTF